MVTAECVMSFLPFSYNFACNIWRVPQVAKTDLLLCLFVTLQLLEDLNCDHIHGFVSAVSKREPGKVLYAEVAWQTVNASSSEPPVAREGPAVNMRCMPAAYQPVADLTGALV